MRRLRALVSLVALPLLLAAGGDRRTETSYIVVHAVSGPIVGEPASWTPRCAAGPVVFTGKTEKSARAWADELRRDKKTHFVVGEGGEVEVALDKHLIANHAGYSRIGRDPRSPNEFSLAIELLNDGDGVDPYEPAQLAALVCLVAGLQQEFGVPLDHIVRHSDIDARSVVCPTLTPPVVKVKQDPGASFPWSDFIVKLGRPAPCS